MGDNVYLGDRNGVRTPMQWTGDRNAGFSKADPARLYAPPIMDSVYGYQAINVEAQERSPYSLLNWMKRLIALRRQNRVFGRGTLEFLVPDNRRILAFIRRYGDEVVLCVANLSRTIQPVELDLSAFEGYTPVEMLGQTEFPRIGKQGYVLTIGVYGFYWFKLHLTPTSMTARVAIAEPPVREEAAPLFMGAAWDTLLEGNVRALIERDLLPDFVRRQRWFGGKGRELRRVRFVDWGPVRRAPTPLFATIVEVDYAGGDRDQYFVPLSMSAGREADQISERYPNAVLGRISGARKGLLHDASVDPQTGHALLDAIARSEQVALRRGTLRGWRTPELDELRGDAPLDVAPATAEQSNSMIRFGERLLLKMFRRISPGSNPDVEITRYLTSRKLPARVPPIAGGIEYQPHGEIATDIGMLQQRIGGQGDGWQQAIAELGRYFEGADVQGSPSEGMMAGTTLPWLELAYTPIAREALDLAGTYLGNASTLGRRTAELHLALAADGTNPAFAPEPLTKAGRAALSSQMRDNSARGLDELEAQLGRLTEGVVSQARDLLANRERVLHAFDAVGQTVSAVSLIRVHGDYHLGQLIWSENDYYLIDFEGEPARSLAERRAKQVALKDVAGMLRSFAYAAYAGLSAHLATRPDQLPRLEPWARAWQAWVSAAFLRTYLDVAGAAAFLPAETRETERLLDAFVLDKAFYELRYELNTRPDWVRVPLWSILRLLNRTILALP
jgi:maltose alpha-D-glucosyltransferase/alpha-amylase